MNRVKLSDICTVVSGATPKSPNAEYWDGDIAWVTPAEIDDDTHYVFDTERHLTDAGFASASLHMMPVGTVLLTTRAPIGKVAIAKRELCCNQGFKNLICSESIAPEYLYRYLKCSTARLQSMGRGATFKELSKKNVESIEVPLPTIEEQWEISRKLEEAESERLVLQKLQSGLDQLVKSRFVEMFGDPLENPKQLPIMRIDEIADVQTGATPLRSNAAYYGGSIPWVKTGEVAAGLLEEPEETITDLALQETNCKLFPAGTILIAMYGQGDTRGKAAILRQAAATNQACAAILLNEGYDADFILAQLNLRYEDLRSRSLGGNQKNLSLKIVKAYELVVPPIEQQKAFMAFVQQVDKLKSDTQQAIDRLQMLYDSLAQEYFGS